MLEMIGGFVVWEENRGANVLRTARVFRPDLVLLDRNLCDMDGLTVATQLRGDPEFQAVPIVIMTGSVHSGDGSIEGMPVLPKPFTTDDLIRVTTEMLPAAA